MVDPSIEVRVATPADRGTLYEMMMLDAEEVKNYEPEKYKAAADMVLNDPDYGFFILALKDGKGIGFMFFTFEWSDWRNGMFYWV